MKRWIALTDRKFTSSVTALALHLTLRQNWCEAARNSRKRCMELSNLDLPNGSRIGFAHRFPKGMSLRRRHTGLNRYLMSRFLFIV